MSVKAQIITIGDEILIGQIINSNSAYIAQKLNSIGIRIDKILTISDSEKDIKDTLEYSLNEVDIIILTGGLGPTNDDLTKKTLCSYFDGNLILNDVVLSDIEKYLLERGINSVNSNNKSQAFVPDNCTIIRNYNGTAPGMIFTKNNKIIISVPGVPFEMKEMIDNYCLSFLKSKFTLPIIKHTTIVTIGLPEAHLAEKLSSWEANLHKNIKLAYLPSAGLVKLRLSSYDLNDLFYNELIKKYKQQLIELIGGNILSFEDKNIEEIIAELLKKNNITLSTAESCTGGNIARLITSIPGSSLYFIGSIIAYSNIIKNQFLNVSFETIQKYGVVSKEVVEIMSKEILQKFNTDYSIAISGIAGPEGGSESKPVGTTWISISDKNGYVFSKKYIFGNDRNRNIERASITAMKMLYDELRKI